VRTIVATRRKALAFAANQRHARVGIAVDIPPDVGQFAMHVGIGGGESALVRARTVHHDFKHAVIVAREFQRGISGVERKVAHDRAFVIEDRD